MKKIWLAMMVGNEEAVIERCLDSFKDAFDGLAVCFAYGASVADETLNLVDAWCHRNRKELSVCYHYNAEGAKEWIHTDRFDRPRTEAWNLAFQMGAEWVFWCDADDVLAAGSAAVLREMAEKHLADLYISPYVTGADGNYEKRERLMHRSAWNGWKNAVHEILDVKPGTTTAFLPELQVLHAPLMTKRGSRDRNVRILESIPEADRTEKEWYYLHTELMNAGRINDAIVAGLRAVDCGNLHPNWLCRVYLNIGEWLKDEEQAERAVLEALRLQPERAEAPCRLAQIHLERGNFSKALAWARLAGSCVLPEILEGNHQPECYGWWREDLLDLSLSALGKTGEVSRRRSERFRRGGMKISVCHPTCRPEKAVQIRKLWLTRAIDPESIEWIFGVNEGDPEVVEKLKHYQCAVSPAVTPGHSSAVANYNAATAAATGKIFICAQDDIYPPQGWDEMIFSRLKKHLGGPKLLHVFDGFRRDWLMVLMCGTRAYLRKHGPLMHPGYDGYYSDTEFSWRASRTPGLVIRALDVPFFHDHPTFTGAKADEAYYRQQNPMAAARGKKLFIERNPDAAEAMGLTLSNVERELV